MRADGTDRAASRVSSSAAKAVRRSESQLRESEVRFGTLFDFANDAIFINEPGGRFIEVNRTACERLGYSRAELLAMSPGDIDAPEFAALVPARTDALLRDGNAFFETAHLRRDGTAIPVELSTTVLDLDGRQAILSIARDVSERKRAEAELRASEERFKLMFESAPIAINITRGPEITYANPSYLSMFGLPSLDELRSLSPLELFAPEWRPRIQENIRRRAEGLSVPTVYEAECLRRDGSRFPILMYLTRAAFADGPATVGFIVDITDRKRAEVDRARLATAVEHAADLVVVSDPNGVIEYVNPAFERLTGYSAADVIGRTEASVLRSHFHPPEYYAELDGAFRRGEPWSGMLTDRRRDDSLFEYDASFSPIRDADGKVIGSVEIGRDRTHEREMEADLALEATVRSVLDSALRGVPSGASLEQAAQTMCDALGSLPGIAVVAVFAFTVSNEIAAVAHRAPPGFPATHGPSAHRGAGMHERSAQGPWAEPWEPRPDDGIWSSALTDLGTRAVAFGPIVHGDHVDGVVMVATPDPTLARMLVEKGPTVLDLSTTPSALLAERLHAQRERAELRRSLEHLLVEHAFHPVFQPLVELGTREVVGHEALTRFDSAQRPDLCFADAWAVGLGPNLELATLEAAVAAAKDLPAGRWLDLNVSPRLLADPKRLRAVLWKADRPIVLEITEHEVIEDYGAVREAIRSLGKDVRLAVDDAGAGVANFGHIIELDPDFVKLDMSLVRRVNANLGRQAMVVGMRQFARSAGCRLVAEGIETEEEAATLSGFGVEFGQGYLFGHPEPVEAWKAATR
jgi:PAS domain S-box-containing protein